MSSTDDQRIENTPSHTLAYRRRIDKRMDGIEKTLVQIVGILNRQDLKMDRDSRDHRESFARIDRDLHELKSDAVVSENKILDRFSETIELSRRLSRNDERLDELEQALVTKGDDEDQRS